MSDQVRPNGAPKVATSGNPNAVVSRPVVVTGASGVIGREVLRQLKLSNTPVIALSRDPLQRPQWRLQCAEAGTVIHLAAPTDAVDEEQSAEALKNTVELFAALPHQQIRFILASSLAMAVGHSVVGSSLVPTHVDSSTLNKLDAYAQMKNKQEAMVRQFCEERGWTLFVIRPSNVWSEGRWPLACVGPQAGPLWLVIGPSRHLRLTEIGNCAKAFVLAVHRQDLQGLHELNIDDNAGVDAWTFALFVARASGRWIVRIPVPLNLFAAVMSVGARIVRVGRLRKVPGLLVPERLAVRFSPDRVNTVPAQGAIGWLPDLTAYNRMRSRR